ncbi:Stemmadenine O-acetyltransferase [Linum grandiflorum]
MEASILSSACVRPSILPTYKLTQPIKLNLLDQLTPMSYSPLVLFYPNHAPISHVSTRLKWSLSQTLSLYYPLAGRITDNFAISDFNEGVPFVETRVECTLHDFLGSVVDDQSLLLGSLNNFLPLPSISKALDTAVQLNVFECGGLAIGISFSHKPMDGVTSSAFLRTWAAVNASQLDKVVEPNFSEGPLTTTSPPPRDYVSLNERLWFGGGESSSDIVTRRFVFDGESVGKLRALARSKAFVNPTRAEAVTAFIWKSLMSVTTFSGSNNHPSVLNQSIDLRSLTRKPQRLSRNLFGNFVLFSDIAFYDPSSSYNGPARVDRLAELIRNGVKDFKDEYIKSMSSKTASKAIFEYYDRQVAESDDLDTDVFNFTCWHGFDTTRTDFGWGPTIWVGLGGAGEGDCSGDTAPYYSNLVVLIENARSKGGIEAWFTHEQHVVTALEQNLEFSEFASSDFAILPPTTCAGPPLT